MTFSGYLDCVGLIGGLAGVAPVTLLCCSPLSAFVCLSCLYVVALLSDGLDVGAGGGALVSPRFLVAEGVTSVCLLLEGSTVKRGTGKELVVTTLGTDPDLDLLESPLRRNSLGV